MIDRPIRTPAGSAPELTPDDLAYLERAFRHHPPTGDQGDRYALIRAHAQTLATAVLMTCPRSAELATALKKIEEAMFWANASIARHGGEPR